MILFFLAVLGFIILLIYNNHQIKNRLRIPGQEEEAEKLIQELNKNHKPRKNSKVMNNEDI